MKRLDAVTAVVVVVIWGTNFVAIDFGLRDLPPLLFVALRFFFTAVPAVLFVRPPPVRRRTVIALGMFGCVGQFGLLFVAMALGLRAGVASVVIQSQALFTFAFAVIFLHESVTKTRTLGIVVAAAGLCVIAASRTHATPLLATFLAIAGGASWGVANVITRAARPTRPFALLVYSAAVAPIPLLGLSLTLEGAGRDWHAMTHMGALTVCSLAFVVIGATFVGFGLWYRLLSTYDSSVVAPYAILVPVVGVLSAWLFTAEQPSSAELLGSASAMIGVAMVAYSRPTSQG